MKKEKTEQKKCLENLCFFLLFCHAVLGFAQQRKRRKCSGGQFRSFSSSTLNDSCFSTRWSLFDLILSFSPLRSLDYLFPLLFDEIWNEQKRHRTNKVQVFLKASFGVSFDVKRDFLEDRRTKIFHHRFVLSQLIVYAISSELLLKHYFSLGFSSIIYLVRKEFKGKWLHFAK